MSSPKKTIPNTGAIPMVKSPTVKKKTKKAKEPIATIKTDLYHATDPKEIPTEVSGFKSVQISNTKTKSDVTTKETVSVTAKKDILVPSTNVALGGPKRFTCEYNDLDEFILVSEAERQLAIDELPMPSNEKTFGGVLSRLQSLQDVVSHHIPEDKLRRIHQAEERSGINVKDIKNLLSSGVPKSKLPKMIMNKSFTEHRSEDKIESDDDNEFMVEGDSHFS